MSDPIEDVAAQIAEILWSARTPDGLRAATRPDCYAMAQALIDADRVATPEHDAEVAAKALRDTAERIRAVVENPRWESERFTEHVLIEAGVERLLNDYADLIGPIERKGETDDRR